MSSATRTSLRRYARSSAAEAGSGQLPALLGPVGGAVLGLDDHAAGSATQQVGGRRPDPLLARRRVDVRPVDDVRADPFGFLDERRTGVAGANQPGADLDPRSFRLDSSRLEH